MDYKKIATQLQTASKEMRANVPFLKMVDEIIERMNRQTQEMIWGLNAFKIA